MKELYGEQLAERLHKKEFHLVYFFTPMCGTCQLSGKMLTVVEALRPNLPIASANLNFIPEMARQMEIESVPCLLFIQDGEVKKKLYAFRSVEFLLNEIEAFA